MFGNFWGVRKYFQYFWGEWYENKFLSLGGKEIFFHHENNLKFVHSGAFQCIKIQHFLQPGENIPSKIIRNSFILAYFKALRFKICLNHGKSIDSEIVTNSIYSIIIRNSFILEHFRAFKCRISSSLGEFGRD